MLQPVILYLSFMAETTVRAMQFYCFLVTLGWNKCCLVGFFYFRLKKVSIFFWLAASSRNTVEIWIKELCEDTADFIPFFFSIDAFCKETSRLWPDLKETVLKPLVVKSLQLWWVLRCFTCQVGRAGPLKLASMKATVLCREPTTLS